MPQYEITFIVDPVLSGDEIKQTADNYVAKIKEEGAEIVHVEEMGLRQLAYPIKRRNSGVYYCVEFSAPNGVLIQTIELAMRRDERIMRFLTAALDKYGVQYNLDKREGKIKAYKFKKEAIAKEKAEAAKKDDKRRNDNKKKPSKPAPKPAAKVEAPAETKVETPVEAKAETPSVNEKTEE